MYILNMFVLVGEFIFSVKVSLWLILQMLQNQSRIVFIKYQKMKMRFGKEGVQVWFVALG